MLLVSLALAGDAAGLEKYFEKKAALAKAQTPDEKKAIETLTKLLEEQIGSPGFTPKASKVTFQPQAIVPGDLEYGCLDSFHHAFLDEKDASYKQIVVTDKRIIDKEAKVAIKLREVTGELLYHIACDDTSYSKRGEVKGVPKGDFDEVTAFFALSSQDPDNSAANSVVVLARKKTRVFAGFMQPKKGAKPALAHAK